MEGSLTSTFSSRGGVAGRQFCGRSGITFAPLLPIWNTTRVKLLKETTFLRCTCDEEPYSQLTWWMQEWVLFGMGYARLWGFTASRLGWKPGWFHTRFIWTDEVVEGTKLLPTRSLIMKRITCFEISFNGVKDGFVIDHWSTQMSEWSQFAWFLPDICAYPMFFLCTKPELCNVHVCQACSDFTPAPQICLFWSEKTEERFLLMSKGVHVLLAGWISPPNLPVLTWKDLEK